MKHDILAPVPMPREATVPAFDAHNALTAAMHCYGKIVVDLQRRNKELENALGEMSVRYARLARLLDDCENGARSPSDERSGQAAQQAKPNEG